MRHAVAVSLFTLVGLVPFRTVRADPAPDFLTLARNAIAKPAVLANVHGLYLAVASRGMNSRAMPSVDASMGVPASPFEGGGFGAGMPLGPRFGPAIAMWLAPPTRFLIRRGSAAIGFDNGRLLDDRWNTSPDGTALTNRLRRWALPLLLDPAALGVTVRDAGTTQIGKKPLHVLDATAHAFEMRLYFDPKSHRLVMTEEQSVAERDTYDAYRRVSGIELPFLITRTSGTRVGPGTFWQKVIKYVINPSDLNYQFLHP